MTTPDLPARLADAAERRYRNAMNSPERYVRAWEEVIDTVLRTLATMTEEEVLAEAAAAGANALLQDIAESLRLTLQERVAIALRAAAGLLLARQAGELERVRRLADEREHLVQEIAKLVPLTIGHAGETGASESTCDVAARLIAALGAQLRAAEQRAAAAEKAWVDFQPVSERFYRAAIALPHPLGDELAHAIDAYYPAIVRLNDTLARPASSAEEGETP